MHRRDQSSRSTSAETISIIVPTLNERDSLGHCLDKLSNAQDIEIIVVDGGSTDDTIEIARSHHANGLQAARGRSFQLNKGAAAANGSILLFLHADTLLPPDFDSRIRRTLADSEVAAGAFRFATDCRSLITRFLERTTVLRAKYLGMIFGDQAIFLPACVFSELGGYPHQPIMEDFELIRQARRKGQVRLAPESAVTSGRRWRSNGIIRNTLMNLVVTVGYMLGLSAKHLSSFYQRMDVSEAKRDKSGLIKAHETREQHADLESAHDRGFNKAT